MTKLLSLAIFLTTAALSVGCGGGAPANANTNSNSAVNGIGTGPVKLDPANMPEGINPQPIQPSANTTPGIPATNTVLPKGGTPTPGIPSPEELKRGIKPGVTPTPGIPSPAELKKMMQGKPATSMPTPDPSADTPRMKSSNKLPKKPQ